MCIGEFMSWKRIVFDIETNGLLSQLLDYSEMPYKLNSKARFWCLGVMCKDTKQKVLLIPEKYLDFKAPVKKKVFVNNTYGDINKPDRVEYYYDDGKLAFIKGSEILEESNYNITEEDDTDGIIFNLTPKRPLTKDMVRRVFANAEEVIGHNIINYDLPVLQLFDLIDYEIAFPQDLWEEGSNFKPNGTLFGKKVLFTDTLVWSYLLYADRPQTGGKHSVEAFGKLIGNYKIDFTDFSEWSYVMNRYCLQDLSVSNDIHDLLMVEAQEDDWYETWLLPYAMECKLVDLVLKQEHYGFYFDKDLALRCLEELDGFITERKQLVEPLLPAKPMTQVDLKYYTFPAKQFKKDGTPSATMEKFAEKLNGKIETFTDEFESTQYKLVLGEEFDNKEFVLPYEGAVKTEDKASLSDYNVVKQYLIDCGWEPSEWKERDLTKDSKKKTLPPDKVLSTIERYVTATVTKGNFTKPRLEFLGLPETATYEEVMQYFKDKIAEGSKSLKVIVAPLLRVGATKELCPNLNELVKKEDSNIDLKVIQSLIDYYTYSHRRNSIGGGDDEEGEDGESEYSSGFLSYVREDGRIPTPAMTNASSTSRMQHKVVNLQASL